MSAGWAGTPAGGVREPAVAGSFYPASAAELGRMVDRLLGAAGPVGQARSVEPRPGSARMPPGAGPIGRPTLRGIVVPHAGYVYSGPVAATGYALVAATGIRPRAVVLLGPSHSVPIRGMAVPGHRAWRTPLGEVLLDEGIRLHAIATGLHLDDAAHRSEHSLEVQLPFLQRILPGVSVLPVAVAWDLPISESERLTSLLAEDVLLVVSTDLSHYHAAATARRLDDRTAAAIAALDHGAIGPDDACGCGALRLALAWAARTGLTARLLDLRTSADTAGDASRVVGYGAFALEAPARG